MTHIIHLLFLETSSNEKHFVNWLTSKYGQIVHGKAIHHVELCIPDDPHPRRWTNTSQASMDSGTGNYLSTSIYAGETVSCSRVKTFSNPGYVVCSKVVSSEELLKIKNFVLDSHNRCVGFDGTGMYLAALPVSIRSPRPDATFCSRYVTEALQAAGLECVQGLNPSIVSPSKLFSITGAAGDKRNVGGSVEHKQRAFLSSNTYKGYERVLQTS